MNCGALMTGGASIKGGPFRRIWLLGLGNPWAGDDGVGLALLGQVCRGELPSHVTPLAVGTAPMTALPEDLQADWFILLDGVQAGLAVGQLCWRDPLTPSDLELTHWVAGGSHQLGVLPWLLLRQQLGPPVGRLSLLGVELGDHPSRTGQGLSPAVDAALPVACKQLVDLLRQAECGGAHA